MYGLKAQKLLAQSNGYKQHALKGQKLLAQGNGYKQHALKGQKLLAQGNGYKQHALKGRVFKIYQFFDTFFASKYKLIHTKSTC